ncbi:MAG: hypothetical protein E7439_03945 [Ruminococcaceae bacterium]|nr:hypothetical protein [Oscillospiraceae bacterium]
MNETQKRIKAYKKALPHMKERVVAVAMLFVIAATMLVSASFAWATLSVNPEISSLATTIAANGNLEIALSGPGGLEPSKTAVGDGVGGITETNLKWGNLVNLSHESYGLDFLTLRPARLNTTSLNNSPLTAVQYGSDGRIEGYLNHFAYSNFNASASVFDVFDTTQYGVRAISSVTLSNAHAESFYNKQLEEITSSMYTASQRFSSIYKNNTYMNTVTALVGVHVSVYMSSDSTYDVSCLSYMPTLNKIMADMASAADATGETIVHIANLYLYDELAKNGQTGSYDSLKYDLEDLKTTNYNNPFVTKYSGKITGLSAYITMARNVDAAMSGLAEAQSNPSGDVLWRRDLEGPIDFLCSMSTATLKTNDGEYTALELANSLGTAAKILFGGGTPTAIIKGGALQQLDKLLGTEMTVSGVTVKITTPQGMSWNGIPVGGIPVSMAVDVITNATAPYHIPTAYNEAKVFSENASGSYEGTKIAADTYAMAIDFWVRTNEINSLLMLEGQVKYREETSPVTGYNNLGMEVPMYEVVLTTTGSDGQPTQTTLEVYEGTDENGQKHWYDSTTHEIVDVGSQVPTQKININKIPIGYEGANRVWDELDDPNSDYSQMIQGGTSTTQGSGSCYIFYPESPEDQTQCERLLAAMHIAFVDENGKLLGYADMNTDHMIQDGGRVIVPLEMRMQKETIIIGQDENGNDITESYYITPLTQNEAMRITAIVYLDGEDLTNSDVLSAGSINGQLNIQFGLNKMDSDPLKDGNLMQEYYAVTANLVNKATGELAKRDDSVEFYNAATCVWDIEIAVEGTQPGSVRGQFVSYVNASQGARQEEFYMTYNEETRKWHASVPFSGPGEFRLRSIEIDGVDRLIPTSEVLTVVIPGKSVNGLSCTNWGGDGSSQSIMTADASYKQEVRLVLNSGDGTISKVQGVFVGPGKNVTVDFTTDGGVNYTGTATFNAGGTYTLTYVLIDGTYTPLDPSLYKTISLKLNLRTTISLGLPVDARYYELMDAMEAAVAAAPADQKEQVRKEHQAIIDEHLRVLHYGNGIVGDQNEKGLNLVRDNAGNMSFITDASEPLFIDVRCIITDDQDNILTNLKDVELLYSAGGVTNVLDSDVLEANTAAGYYHGRFTLESNGRFSFYQLTFKELGQDRSYTIYTSNDAPTVTAIQPAPMEYVYQPAYEPLIYDLGRPADQRVLYIKLKNAAAATLDITLTNGNGETAAPLSVTASEPDANNVTTFAVVVPNDGYWKITSVRAKNVFFNDVFYTGLEDDPTTWLSLTEQVAADDIGTHFLTQAYIRGTGNTPSQSYTGAFMAEHKVQGMNVEILGNLYGEMVPLETILRSVGIEANVTVGFQYVLDLDTIGHSYTGTLPTNSWVSTFNEETNMATIAEMDFRVAGTYYPSWTVSIDAVDNAYDYSYTYNVGATKPTAFSYLNMTALESIVQVNWTQLPTVTISSIAPEGQHSAVYYSFSLLGNSWKSTTATSAIAADRLSTTVYAAMSPSGWKGAAMEQYPYVTLQLSNMGNANGGATMTFSKSGGGTVHIYTGQNSGRTSDFVWAAGATEASRYVGSYDWGTLTSVTAAGTLESSAVKLTYDSVTFTFTVSTITINNLAASG